jgi:CRP-like cAMP-binding protein
METITEDLIMTNKRSHTSKISSKAAQSSSQAAADAAVHHYYVFAADRQVYGPATLSLLQEWTSQGLVSHETWVFDEELNGWRLGRQIAQIRNILPTPTVLTELSCGDLSHDQLRRIRIFGDMDDHQLDEMAKHLSKVQIPALRNIVQKGEHGNSLLLLLEGEAAVITKKDGMTKILSTLQAGDFFGESTLVEVAPRPYDVKATMDCSFLLLKHSAFQRILNRHPDIASRFLTGVVRQLSYINLQTSARFADAKALSRSTMSQTGKIELPPMIRKRY